MPPGRKPALELDPELQGKIMRFIRAGAFPERAAAAAGVGERTHYLWQAKGLEEVERRDQGKTPRKTWQVYVEYVTELEQAVAEAEINLMTRAAVSGEAMKLLERRFRERWSAKAVPVSPAPTAEQARATVTALDQFTARREQRRVQGT